MGTPASQSLSLQIGEDFLELEGLKANTPDLFKSPSDLTTK
jgi:hypothetical protein